MWNPLRRRKRQEIDLDRESEVFERKAMAAAEAYRGQYLGRAADLSASAGNMARALELWGRSIDCYLENGRPEAAAAACRKVIHNVPEVVRARRTLALLSIGQGRTSDALGQIREYVDAARRVGRTQLAIKQLRIMLAAAPNAAVERLIRDLLPELGASSTGPAPLEGEECDASPEAPHDRWSRILSAARMTPQEVARL